MFIIRISVKFDLILHVSLYSTVTIVIAPSNETVFAGVTSLFTCVATGIPDPAFSWFLENTEIAEGDRHNITTVTEVIEGVTFVTSILQICEINFSDEGTYWCVADVPGLSDSASFEITIQGVVAGIDVRPMDITVVQGTEVALVCLATGAPLPTVTWTQNMGEMAEGNVTNTVFDIIFVNSTLELGPVEETAIYICAVENGPIVGATADAIVTVQSM